MGTLANVLDMGCLTWGAYNYVTTTSTNYPPYPPYDRIVSVANSNNIIKIKPFNCKKCGAVGQYELCSYCGSAEE